MIPTSSNVPWVGENPFSSASTPKTSEPPGLGVAVETPSGWDAGRPPEPWWSSSRSPSWTRRRPAGRRGADDGDAGPGDGTLGQERAAVDAISHGPPLDGGRPALRRPHVDAVLPGRAVGPAPLAPARRAVPAPVPGAGRRPGAAGTADAVGLTVALGAARGHRAAAVVAPGVGSGRGCPSDRGPRRYARSGGLGDRRLPALGRRACPRTRSGPTPPTSSGSPTGPSGAGPAARPTSTGSPLRRYLAFLATRRYAKATIARTAASLRSYFGWCARRGLVAADPSVRLSAPSPDSRLPRVLGHAELDRLLEPARRAAPRRPARRPRPVRSPRTCATTPCSSCSTAAACGWPSCAGSTSTTSTSTSGVVTVTGKGSKQRQVLVHDRCVEARPGLAGRPPGGHGRRGVASRRPLLQRAGQPARAPGRAPDPRPPVAGAHPPPRPAPQLRHPPARRGRRPPGGAGTARAMPACRPRRSTLM